MLSELGKYYEANHLKPNPSKIEVYGKYIIS